MSSKDFDIVGEFYCKEYDTYALTKLVGGINKGKSSEKDFKNAEDFADGLKEKM